MKFKYIILAAIFTALICILFAVWAFNDRPRFFMSGLRVRMWIANNSEFIDSKKIARSDIRLDVDRKKFFWLREEFSVGYKFQLASVRSDGREYERRELDSIFIKKYVDCIPPCDGIKSFHLIRIVMEDQEDIEKIRLYIDGEFVAEANVEN